MSRKVHLKKLENSEIEVGIQVRSDNPTPLENRIHVNSLSKEMYSHFQGKDRKLNIGVYSTDPVGTMDEVWVNDIELKLKWRANGTVYAMNLANSSSFSNIRSANQFYEFLYGLSNDPTFRDMKIIAPSALYDTFDVSNKDAVFTNVKQVDTAVRVEELSTSGSYELEELQSTPVNHVEGVVSFESQALKALSLIDNLDGTHSVLFSGNVTNLVSVGKKFYIYDEVSEIINTDNNLSNDAVNGLPKSLKNLKAYPLLDSLGKPQPIDIVSYSHDLITDQTTIIFNDYGFDLSLGFSGLAFAKSVRFLPVPFDGVVGGDGLTGVLTALEIKELHALPIDSLKSGNGVIGHDILNKIHHESKYESLNYMFWKFSEDKTKCLIFGRYGTLNESDRWSLWYSRDSLHSIEFVETKKWFEHSAVQVPTDTSASDSRMFLGDGFHEIIGPTHIQMHNDGRFVFSIRQFDSWYSRANRRISYGMMTDNEFIIQHPANKDNAGGSKGGEIAFENSGTHSYYSNGCAMEWDSNIFAIAVGRGNNDSYVQFWYLDFDSFIPIKSGTMMYVYRGLDYHLHHYAAVMFWDDFEGQRCLFVGMRHLNHNFYAHKLSREAILTAFRTTYNYKLQSQLPAPFGIPGSFSSVTSYEGGVTTSTAAWMHEIGSGTQVDHYHMTSDNKLVCVGTDTTNLFQWLSITDFGRTSGGSRSVNTLTFDQAPTLGNHAVKQVVFDSPVIDGTFSITFNNERGSLSGNVLITFGDTNDQIESAISAAISWIGYKECVVTGDWNIGFTFTFEHYPEDVTLITNLTTLIHSGANIVSNGTFDTDILGWTSIDDGLASCVWSGGRLQTEFPAGQNTIAETSFPTVIGKTYTLRGNFYTDQISLLPFVKIGPTPTVVPVFTPNGDEYVFLAQAAPNGKIKVTFTATSILTYLALTSNSSGVTRAEFDNITVTEDIPIVETYNNLVPGVLSLGGSISLNVQAWRKNTVNVKAVVNSSTIPAITAGMSHRAIENAIMSATTQVGVKTVASQSENYPVKISRAKNRRIYEAIPLHSPDRDFIGKDFFNVRVNVGTVDYTLTLEVVNPETGVVIWMQNTTYLANSGQHNITIDPMILEGGSVLSATSFVQHDADYGNGNFEFAYSLNYLSDSGVQVTGDWVNGIVIENLIRRDLRYTVLSNALVSGVTPVVPTITNTHTGSEIVGLKYDNDPILTNLGLSSGFLTGGNRSADGVSYTLRSEMYSSNYILGRSQTTASQYYQDNSFLRGDSLLFAHDIQFQEYAHDQLTPMFVKIPNFREMHGRQIDGIIGARTAIFIADSNSIVGAQYARRWSQIINVPDLQYSDARFPLRTIEIQLRKSWGAKPKNFSKPGVYIRIKILGLTAGFPDDTNVIATSITQVPVESIPFYTHAGVENFKRLPFIFDNVLLTPGSQIALEIDIVGHDVEAQGNDFFRIEIGGRSNAAGAAYSEVANVWSSKPYDLWYRFYDYYMIMPHFNHIGGFNHVAVENTVYNSVVRGVKDATIGVVGDSKTSQQFIGTYTTGTYPMHNNGNLYSPFTGGVNCWAFEIDNENIISPLHPPIIKDPEILGVEDPTNHDQYLVMAHAFGYSPDGIKGLRIEPNGKPTKFATSLNKDNDDFYYNSSAHFGGYEVSSDHIHYSQNRKYIEAVNSVYTDDDLRFKYGKCVKSNGGLGLYIHNDSKDMVPYGRDFCIEFEYIPDNLDLIAANKMIFGCNGLYYISMPIGFNGKNVWNFHAYNDWDGNNFSVEEPIIPEVYQRVRIQRNQTSGIQFWINYSKDSEATWVQLTLDVTSGAPLLGEFGANGYSVGSSATNRDYFGVLRWTESGAHHCYGRLGYMKIAIGSDSFVYPGLNFDQPEISGIRNNGDKMLCYLKHNVGYVNVRERAKTTMIIAKHSSQDSALVNTPKFLAKFDQPVTAGRKKSVKVNMKRESVSDPSKLNGYLLEYYKK